MSLEHSLAAQKESSLDCRSAVTTAGPTAPRSAGRKVCLKAEHSALRLERSKAEPKADPTVGRSDYCSDYCSDCSTADPKADPTEPSWADQTADPKAEMKVGWKVEQRDGCSARPWAALKAGQTERY